MIKLLNRLRVGRVRSAVDSAIKHEECPYSAASQACLDMVDGDTHRAEGILIMSLGNESLADKVFGICPCPKCEDWTWPV